MSAAWEWVGAKWWRFDFHNHTPASLDYGKGHKQAELARISPSDWLLGYMRKGIDCVAVTDHNSGEWIDKLKDALDDLATQRHPEYRPLYIFPGVEITAQGNIHILALFDLDRSTTDILDLLGAVRYRGSKGGSDDCTECTVVQVIEEIVKAGGLAIPAHVDKEKGLFYEFSGGTLSQVLNCENVRSMEVVDTGYVKPQLYTDRKLNWSEIRGSDSHHPSGNAGDNFPGSNFTWVKMSRPSLAGLRLSLIDGPLSLRRSDVYHGDPNSYARLAIERIVIHDAKYLGRGLPHTCEFNPWLNTIIGGRGTGKSTSLELLRIAVKRKGEIPTTLEGEFSKYGQTSTGRQDEGLLTGHTRIEVYLRKDEGRFRIIWSNSDDSYLLEEESVLGTWSVADGDIPQRFPVRMYSQKQIFELAKHPEALMQVVDDASSVNYREWQLEWDELHSKYLSIRAQEREVQAGLREESVIKGQLDDVRRKLEVFERTGHADVLRAYQLGQNQLKAIDAWEATWKSSSTELRLLMDSLLPSVLDTAKFSEDNPEDKELIDSTSKVQLFFGELQAELESIAQRIDGRLDAWRVHRGELRVTQRISTGLQEYKALLDQLSEVGAGDPSEYSALVKQRQGLEEKLSGFRRKKDALIEYQKNAGDCLAKIKNHRLKLTDLRSNFLAETLAKNSYVQIDVIPFGSRDALEEQLRSLIGRGGGGFERDIGKLDGEEGLLSILTAKGPEPIEQRIELVKSILCGIYRNIQPAMALAKDRRFVSHIQSLKPEQIDRVECWYPDDSLDVQYSLNNGRGFKPVEQGSPGQKTAALLAFILSYGNEPLILDQPEDDLDNHLIYDLIVSQLREIKRDRQVLVVTHNANIVVNGDAENVIVLDIRSGQTQIVSQGGLQDSAIRDEICRVMEGGRYAFDQRYKRITGGL
jgi:hypothetical protein